ncbi:SRPBCC domain-containing protein [Thermoflavifilum sp.]|uniref:SRPBCC domain-containing protein n=1 Tax=Thermoflavifilum sp. TaxID=1968839 RepID=UPI0025D63E1F|nr:SRPBCC domain-containing protein [Thermoflavifilum sp.]
MMNNNLIARASITINAPAEKVWSASVNPEAIKQFMFGRNVATDWRVGNPITWKGKWQGKSFEDKERCDAFTSPISNGNIYIAIMLG